MASHRGNKPEPQEAQVQDLANQLRVSRRSCTWQDHPGGPDDEKCTGAVFLVGAGCSRSAGIPLSGEIAQACVPELARELSNGHQSSRSPKKALQWLIGNNYLSQGKGWPEYYVEIFDRYYKSSSTQRAVIQESIARGRGLINWAHICLGELVDKHYVHTVLTTNFDQLVLQGVVLTGRIPVVADGTEAVTRISSKPTTPQVIHLHGSMHTYSPRNSRRALKEVGRDPAMKGTLLSLLKDASILVVVGYAGGEDGIIDNLREATEIYRELVIYWVLHENSISVLRREVRAVIAGQNKFYIPGQDADAFFAELAKKLELKPGWMADPLAPIEARLRATTDGGNADIGLALKGYGRSVRELQRQAPDLQDDDAVIERAAMDSLAGQDDAVVAQVREEMGRTNGAAARLLALSFRRLGDAAKSAAKTEELLRLSADYWHVCIRFDPENGEPFVQLGQTFIQRGDLRDHDGEERANLLDQAMQAFRTAVEKTPRSRKGWVECRLLFAAAAIEAGTRGAERAVLEEATTALQQLLRNANFDVSTNRGSRIFDHLATLNLMLANLNGDEAQFVRAVKMANSATSGVWKEMTSTDGVGAHRDLAAAHRDYGIWLQAVGRTPEARTQYSKAKGIFGRVDAAYRGELEGAQPGELQSAISATRDAVIQVQGLIDALP